VRLIRADNKRTQLCLQTELVEKNHNHFTHRSCRGEHNKSTSRKTKIITLKCYKNVLYAGPKYFDKLKPKPEPGPTRPEKHAQTYNSAPCQKFHSKSFTCITTQIYLRLNKNAQL